jgi:hypothetical protein
MALRKQGLFYLVSPASMRYAYSASVDDFSNYVKSNPFSPIKGNADETDQADERGFNQ